MLLDSWPSLSLGCVIENVCWFDFGVEVVVAIAKIRPDHNLNSLSTDNSHLFGNLDRTPQHIGKL